MHAAQIAMRSGPEEFRPFDGPSGDVLRPQWEALHSEVGELWKLELKEVDRAPGPHCRCPRRPRPARGPGLF
jgi:hypothetical protein